MEQNYTDDTEIEINLTELLAYFVRKWKTILVFALIFAALLAGFKALRSSNEDITQANEKYQQTLTSYQAQKNALDMQIADLSKQISDQQTYRENSVLMNIDPFNEYRCTLSVYVSTDYQIMPGMDYQNPDPTLSILGAYAQIAQNGELYEQIHNKLSRNINMRDLRELITVTADNESRILSIVTLGDTEELAKELMEYVRAELDAHKSEISQMIAEHEITVIQESSLRTTDLNLFNTIKNFDNNLNTLQQNLSKAQDNLESLGDAPEAPGSATIQGAYKGILKFAILGLLLGILIALCLLFFQFTKLDLLPDREELSARYHLLIFGKVTDKKKQGCFASLSDKLRGINRKNSPGVEEEIDVIGEYLKSLKDLPKSICLISDMDPTAIKDFQEKLSERISSTRFTAGGDIFTNPAAIASMRDAGSALLLLSRDKTRASYVRQTVTACRNCGQKMIGAVIFE